MVAHTRREHGDWNRVFEPAQGANDERAMCPRTRIGHVEMIAALRRRKACARLPRNVIAKCRCLALERAARRGIPPRLPFSSFESSHGFLPEETLANFESQRGQRMRTSCEYEFVTHDALEGISTIDACYLLESEGAKQPQ